MKQYANQCLNIWGAKMKKYLYALWTAVSYGFAIAVIASCIFGGLYWLADGDVKCMLAADPATCAAIKSKGD